MIAEEEATPQDVLQAFWAEMHAWETSAYRTMPSHPGGEDWERFQADVWSAWVPIFEKHCTPKKRAHMPSGLYRSIGSPPKYDPAEELITAVTQKSPSRVVIKTLRTLFPTGEHFYVFLRRGGRWLIDSRQGYDYDGKIRRGSL